MKFEIVASEGFYYSNSKYSYVFYVKVGNMYYRYSEESCEDEYICELEVLKNPLLNDKVKKHIMVLNNFYFDEEKFKELYTLLIENDITFISSEDLEDF